MATLIMSLPDRELTVGLEWEAMIPYGTSNNDPHRDDNRFHVSYPSTTRPIIPGAMSCEAALHISQGEERGPQESQRADSAVFRASCCELGL